MTKYIVALLVLLTAIAAEASQQLPQDAVRIRVIANSDALQDQVTKERIHTELARFFTNDLHNPTTSDETERQIRRNWQKIIHIVDKQLIAAKQPLSYQLNLGKNAFPEKQFGTKKYRAGYYQSLVVTIGAGKGRNWWCVLYPNICFRNKSKPTRSWFVDMYERWQKP